MKLDKVAARRASCELRAHNERLRSHLDSLLTTADEVVADWLAWFEAPAENVDDGPAPVVIVSALRELAAAAREALALDAPTTDVA